MDDKHTSYLINAESLSYQLLGYSGILHSDDSFLLNVNQVEQILHFWLIHCVSVGVIYRLPAGTGDLLKQFLEIRQKLEWTLGDHSWIYHEFVKVNTVTLIYVKVLKYRRDILLGQIVCQSFHKEEDFLQIKATAVVFVYPRI